ncbi:hypothetical protein PM082_022373 [Marasmius tenuissimus]|nr:hypothetical protein PM082_022373 [Marasmius tenuissimus]
MDSNAADWLQVSIGHAQIIEDCFSQRFSSLYSPAIVSQHISAVEGDIVRLDAEIAKLDSTSDSLENHRDRLTQCVKKGRMLIPPPIHRLPCELLSHIFTMSCADGDGINLCPPTSRPWNRSPSEPVMLSMVCSSWRETAISTPQLWSVVRLENSTQLNSEVAAERLGQMTEVFMTRARTSPLTIRISDFWGPGISKTYPTGVDRALEALCQRSLQWVDVDFTQCSPSFCGVPAFRNIKGNFPNLRRIAIEADGLLEFKKFAVIFDGSQCPVLKEVELAGVRDRQDQLLRTFSWKGIEHFKVWHSSALDGGPSPLVFVSMCPELKSLDFSFYFGGASSSEVRPLTSNIESLILQIIHTPWADTTWVPFLDRITLPRLSELMIIKYLSDKRIGDISPLLQCISRSECIITSLSIGSSNLSKQQNYDLLSHIPGLTFLSIYDDDPD